MFEYLIYSACGENRVRKLSHVLQLFLTVQAEELELNCSIHPFIHSFSHSAIHSAIYLLTKTALFD